MLLAALALASVATSANALTLVNAAVTGASGTIWTTAHTGNYTLFLSAPAAGDYLNPNDESLNFGVASSGISRVLLTGEGYTPGTTANSDAVYNLTLSFDGGQSLTGSYTPGTNTFLGDGSSIVSGGSTYSLIEFSFIRNLGDSVQPNVAIPGGDGNDYNGNFRLNAVAAGVPEPASWALMIVGFGMVGVTARRRARPVVTYA
jgi:hypothetical protein